MAIDSISTQSTATDNPYESSDPKLTSTKLLLESMFGYQVETEETLTDKIARINSDSAEISAEAVALYQSQSVEVTAKTKDGGEIKIVYKSEEMLTAEVTQSRETAQPQKSDPLILDLNNNGIELTDTTKGEGVLFDINADGVKENVSWVGKGDGMLAMDRNGNGAIDNGGELFGDQHGAKDGFAELAKLDANEDGTIDKNDAVFNRLNVWQDLNMNGMSETGELKSLKDYGIEAMSFKSNNVSHTVSGNLVSGYSGYQTTTGFGKIGEAYLNYYA